MLTLRAIISKLRPATGDIERIMALKNEKCNIYGMYIVSQDTQIMEDNHT